jgi:hypothetical protein
VTSRHKRSKTYGYATEVAALEALRKVFPYLRRTGSVAYKKDAADLVQDGAASPFRLIVTRDKRKELLVTMSIDDFVVLVGDEVGQEAVVVQVKGRERTWVGSLYAALKKAT